MQVNFAIGRKDFGCLFIGIFVNMPNNIVKKKFFDYGLTDRLILLYWFSQYQE
jgi:hypothetical protein